MTTMQGKCLCGAVTVTATPDSKDVCACHCAMCRRWGGGPFVDLNVGNNVEFSGDGAIRVYGSSAWAERGFCQRCGTHLFYRLRDGSLTAVPVGLFDDDDGLVLNKEVFVDEQPAYYRFANDTHRLTGPELMALFGADDSA